jgi:prepilin-type processing-associated H-X9-DG protein
MATEDRGKFPDLHNSLRVQPIETYGNGSVFPYWYTVYQRDRMLKHGLTRELAYCPSNPGLNTDTFWTWPTASNASIWGYMYFGATRYMNPVEVDGGTRGWQPTVEPIQLPWFAMRQSDQPAFDLLWADVTRSYNGSLMSGTSSLANHIPETTELAPGNLGPGRGGTNTGYLDGHVAWTSRDQMEARFYRGTFKLFW